MVVGNSEKKPIIGILGGIACGKSTAAQAFCKLGCRVIDADEIAHKVLDKPGVKAKISKYFGEETLDTHGRVDRRRLAKIVFGDPAKAAKLNALVHPLVLAEAERLIADWSRDAAVKAIVLDMPLLVEAGWAKRCDRLVFVRADARLRAERARKKGIFSEDELAKRENFQISLDKKASLADNVIENNSGVDELARQVGEIFSIVVDNE